MPGVIGLDLKNEPHGAATWGTGNAATDWNSAAERASAVVLSAAPNWLIFVEGVSSNPSCSSNDAHFWGENLEAQECARPTQDPGRSPGAEFARVRPGRVRAAITWC